MATAGPARRSELMFGLIGTPMGGEPDDLNPQSAFDQEDKPSPEECKLWFLTSYDKQSS